ncbi:MAG: hypothetical protein EXR66_03160 [Dehalococcoidia bacterium]|nr:hypothetical protein [Dehalococcoidia bacterium]
MTDQVWVARGEVTDREDLLDGRVRVELAGEAGEAGEAGAATIEAGFGWRRARDFIALEAADSFLTVIEGDSEFHAAAMAGSVTTDPETGATRIEAQFIIEDSIGLGATLMPIAAVVLVGSEEWSGEFSLGMRLGN